MNKKFASLVGSLFFLLFTTVKVQAGAMGITLGVADIDGTGTETVQDGTDKNKTSGTSSESVSVPSFFLESDANNGWVLGIDVIPIGAEFVSSSKTQTNVQTNGSTTSHTQKVEGELENHITLYLEKEVLASGGMIPGVYLKAGVITVSVKTNESIGTGSEYGDDNLFGYTVGLGFKGDIGDSTFYKLEGFYNDYETIEISSSNTENSVTGEIDAIGGRLSIGYRF